MTQTPIKKPKTLRKPTAMLAGPIPFILAFLIMYVTTHSTMRHQDTGWVKYLVQHQDTIILALIVSSVMVALFYVLLDYKKSTITLAGLQIGAIHAMLISTGSPQNIILNSILVTIIVLPMAILAYRLKSEASQPIDQESTRIPTECGQQDNST